MKQSPDELIVDYIHRFYQNQSENTPACWFIDDNASPDALKKIAQLTKQQTKLTLVTNRFDKFAALEQAMVKADNLHFNDFDISHYKTPLNAIFFRIAKEKPLNLYWINQAFQYLAEGGELIFVGNKGDGVKSIIKHAENRFNAKAQQTKHKPDAILAVVKKLSAQNGHTPLDDRDYPTLRNIGQQNTLDGKPITESVFYSKPGVFGWDKIDQGSQLLIDTLPDLLGSLTHKPTRLLDLGCGYGYITAMAARLHEFENIVATDNNATALLAAEKTFAENGINADCIAADAGEQINEKFDLILCNPPFHQGFSVDGGLTHKFLTHTKRLLVPNGCAIYVVNAFIGLEKLATSLGLHTELVKNNAKFKVIKLSIN